MEEQLIGEIKKVFSAREMPKTLYEYSDNLVDDMDEVLPFAGMELKDVKQADALRVSPPASVVWEDVTLEMLENSGSAFCFFSPEAFVYYLPSIMTLSLKENDPELFAILGVLTRSRGDINLDASEYAVFQKWISWLFENENFGSQEQKFLDNVSKFK